MRRVAVALGVGVGLALAGCGASDTHLSIVHGKGDKATFVLGGHTVAVQESGTAKVRISGAPEMNYDGPVGCAGRFFTADDTDNVNAYFRYGSQDAFLLDGSQLTYIGGPPERHGGQLEWQTTTGGESIDIRVSCPPPPAGPRLAPPRVPDACAVATPAIARRFLGGRVDPARSGLENPELGYCSYKRHGHNGRMQVSVASSTEIKTLLSWEAQPAVAGYGDAARGGNPDDGFDVIAGRYALEIVIAADNNDTAANVAAEEAAAKLLLPRLG